jgi:hypothetical protein
MPPKKGTKAKPAKGKGQAKYIATSDEEMKDVEAKQEAVSPVIQPTDPVEHVVEDVKMNPSRESTPVAAKPGLTPHERVAKMAALREKMVRVDISVGHYCLLIHFM